MTDNTAARLKALPRIALQFTPDAPANNPFPEGWIEDAAIMWAGDRPMIEPRATGGDVETKMAVHFAHDARDPVILKRLVKDRIARWRSGHEYEGSRWGEDDEDERGAFPADKVAFGDLHMFREALAADMMTADNALTIEEARATAEAVLNPRNLRITNELWSRWRRVIKLRRQRAKHARNADHRAEERKRIVAYRRANPDKVKEARRKDATKRKQVRDSRAQQPSTFVAIDSEGFDTGRHFSKAHVRSGLEACLIDGTMEPEGGEAIERDHEWYAAVHSNPQRPNALNKTFDGEILREHKTFLWGARNDERRDWLCRSSDGAPKVALSSEEILNWIVGLKKTFPHSRFVSFSFSYDATQILADLDYQTAVALQRGERRTCSDEEWETYNDEERERHIEEVKTVFWRNFAIAYRKGKMFKVGKLRDRNNPYKVEPCKNAHRAETLKALGLDPVDRVLDYAPGGEPVTIDDAFGFFQTSFLNALDGMKIDVTDDELALLEDGKGDREIMASLPLARVKRYTGLELIMLARMMDKLRRALMELGLAVDRWQGAGAIAEAMFKRYRTAHYSPYVATRNIPKPQEWAHYAFFGGRIELCKQGKHVGELYAYDVTSAYPAEQSALPAMALPIYEDAFKTKVKSWRKGKWTYIERDVINRAMIARMSPYSIIELKFDFATRFPDDDGRGRDAPFFPLPYRDAKGSILFPAKGRGRYYRDEVLAGFEWLDVMMGYASEAVREEALIIEGAYVFDPPRDDNGEMVYPYAFLKDYYEERRRITKEADDAGGYDVREKVVKLGINSAYGKMAQGVGGTKTRAPKTANPWVAGAITAGTRAKLLRAALKAPWDVLFFATDGIHSLKELGAESPTKILGGWEKGVLTAGIWAQPGVYAYSKIGRGGKVKFEGKSRGMSPKSFLADNSESDGERDGNERLFNFYDANLVPLWAKRGGELTILQQRYLTFGFAASSPENWAHAGCWLETSRTIDAKSGGVKRENSYDTRRVKGVVPLTVKRNSTPDEMSAPHVPEWLDEEQGATAEWDREMEAVAQARFYDPDECGVGIVD